MVSVGAVLKGLLYGECKGCTHGSISMVSVGAALAMECAAPRERAEAGAPLRARIVAPWGRPALPAFPLPDTCTQKETDIS